MASSSVIASSIGSSTSSSSISKAGLLRLASPASSGGFQRKTRLAMSGARTTCFLETSLVISLCTATSLSLGRFVFLRFHREQLAKAGPPMQNGMTHFEAGDVRAKPYTDLLKTGDPAGFNIVDVLAWGSIGHLVAYFILATSSNGYEFPS